MRIEEVVELVERPEELEPRIKKMLEPAASLRKPHETIWSISRGYYLGNQHLEVRGNRVVQARPSRRSSQLISNQILPRVRALVSGLTANPAVMQAVAADEDDGSARSAAALSDEILNALRGYVRLDAAIRTGTLYATIFGKGFLLGNFNPMKGRRVTVQGCQCGERMIGEDGVPMCCGVDTSREVMTGDFYACAVSPFQLLVDDSALRLGEAAWISIDHYMSKSAAETMYGGRFREQTVDISIDLMPNAESVRRKAVKLREILWAGAPGFDLGYRLLMHEKRVLAADPECSGDGVLPVGEIVADEAPERFWPIGIVEPLVPLQDCFNRAMRSHENLAKIAGNPRLKAEEGSLVSTDENAPEAGKIVYYRKEAMKEPGFETAPTGTAIISTFMRELSSQMDFIAQQFAPSRGEPGAGVTSGLQARLLIERTATSLSLMSSSIEDAVARIGKVLLLAAQNHMTEERTFTFAGDNGRARVLAFRGADLVGVQDVRVVAGSASPASREARRELLLAVAQQVGTLGPEFMRPVLEAMKAGIKMPIDPLAIIHDQAADENEVLLRGGDVDVDETQMHDIHIRDHQVFAASDRVTKNQTARVAILTHIKTHEFASMREQIQKSAELAEMKRLVSAPDDATPVEPSGDADAAPLEPGLEPGINEGGNDAQGY